MHTAWLARRRWAPGRSNLPDPHGDDGSHMGWPARTDRRLFQLAPDDQWSTRAAWPIDAEYALSAVGRAGTGFAGRLPRLQPQALLRRRADSRLGHDVLPRLALQTVWFLPDRGVGVVWWHGSVAIEGVLSDEIESVALALRPPDRLLEPVELLAALSTRRSADVAQRALADESAWLPPADAGWVVELIDGPDDHPAEREPGAEPTSAAVLRDRARAHAQDLARARRDGQRLDDLQAVPAWRDRHVADSAAPAPGTLTDFTWRERLQALACRPEDAVGEGARRELHDVVIEEADLSGLDVAGLRLQRVQLRRCDLSGSRWQDCHFEDVVWSDCAMQRSQWGRCTLLRHGIERCRLDGSRWHDCEQSHGRWTDVAVGGASCVQGRWDTLDLQHVQGHGLALRALQWRAVSWQGCRVESLQANTLRTERLALVDTCLPSSQWRDCAFSKFSAVRCDLSGSRWTHCEADSFTVGAGSLLRGWMLSDCTLDHACLIGVDVQGARWEHDALPGLQAQRLLAADVQWSGCVLDGADLMHADLSRSEIRGCALKDANWHGADLRGSRVRDCSLVRLQQGFIHRPDAFAWRDNLTTGSITLPLRRS